MYDNQLDIASQPRRASALKLKKVKKKYNFLGLATGLILLAIWQVMSFFTPSYLFPPVQSIFKDLVSIFSSWDLASNALSTIVRIIVGLASSFVIGTLLGIFMGMKDSIEKIARPILNFAQGVPALSWVVIAVIWFRPVEARIFFILLVTTVPNFALQIFDSYRAISKDLWEMLLVVRPRASQIFRILIIPSIVPDILTAWRINIGYSTRVAIVAELVGATIGVGYQLASAQSLFNMSLALAWTLVLVIFVLIVQMLISYVERFLLSWRPNIKREG